MAGLLTRRLAQAGLGMLSVTLTAYVAFCLYLWVRQESILFHPVPLPQEYSYAFDRPFEERRIAMPSGESLDALFFQTPGPRGAVLLLGGNARSAREIAPHFIGPVTGTGYDLIVLDYPGFGKSTGAIVSEPQLHSAVDATYTWLRRQYPEGRLVVMGYSIGTGPATWLACHHHPQRLVLLAPFFSLEDEARRIYPYVPMALLRYPMRNDLELAHCQTPVSIFHGDADTTIRPQASERLAALLKPTDRTTFIAGAGHDDLPDYPEFQQALRKLLEAGAAPLAQPPKGVKIKR